MGSATDIDCGGLQVSLTAVSPMEGEAVRVKKEVVNVQDQNPSSRQPRIDQLPTNYPQLKHNSLISGAIWETRCTDLMKAKKETEGRLKSAMSDATKWQKQSTETADKAKRDKTLLEHEKKRLEECFNELKSKYDLETTRLEKENADLKIQYNSEKQSLVQDYEQQIKKL